MDELWLDLCEHKLLLSPGSYFVLWQGKEMDGTEKRGGERGVGHFRVAFSMATVSFTFYLSRGWKRLIMCAE